MYICIYVHIPGRKWCEGHVRVGTYLRTESDGTERTQRQTDGRLDGRTDGQTARDLQRADSSAK